MLFPNLFAETYDLNWDNKKDFFNIETMNQLFDLPKVTLPKRSYDLVETEKGANLIFNVAGKTKENISVRIENNVLIVEVKEDDSKEEKDSVRFSSFKKQFDLTDFDTEKITVELKNGLLSVEVEKYHAPVKNIEIK